MQQSGKEGGASSDRQCEKRRNNESVNATSNGQNSILSALPPPMPTRKIGDQHPVANNVEMVITKAKKAATYLYTLLHAKNCRLSADRCSHPGCAEAKLMYLHLKTCRAEGISCCSTEYKGCVDARKLLLHYRRCRDIRSRKASGQGNSEPHFCLVCSLVARNAKSKGRSLSPNESKTRKQLMPPGVVRCSPVNQSQKQQKQQPYKQELRVRPRSFSFSDIGRSSAKPTIPSELIKTMPPPPPRFAVSNLQRGAANDAADAKGLQDTMSSALAVHRSEHRDQLSNNARLRSESLDLHKSRFLQPSLSNELEQQPTDRKVRFQVRRRSASLDVLSSTTANVIQTIEEEPVGEELQEMLEGDR